MRRALENVHDDYNVKVRMCDRLAQADSSDDAFGLLVLFQLSPHLERSSRCHAWRSSRRVLVS